MIKLSHSSVSRYLKCGESYRLHYIEKMRPNVSSSALLFGSALDQAINSILLKSQEDPFEVFMKNWKHGWVNNVLIELPMSTQIVYAASDFDRSILSDSDLDLMKSALSDLKLDYLSKDPLEVYNEVFNFKKQSSYRTFRENEFKYLNYSNWLCMVRKGELLIEAFKTKVLPIIKEVHAVQKEITLEDDKGNKVTGFIDFIATLEDGNKYVLDLKTSARPYEDDAVESSPQLSLYAYHEELSHAGYIVLQKNIKKNKQRRCSICSNIENNNRVKSCSAILNSSRCYGELVEETRFEGDVQIVLGKINPKVEEMVISNLDKISHLIEHGIFLKNPDSCLDWYGTKCPYWGLCHKGDKSGLVVEN